MNKQLLAAVSAVFATYPDAEAVLVCEDGNVFLEERDNLAKNHCREARLNAPLRVTREEVGAPPAEQVAKDAAAAEEQARKDAEAAAAEQAAKDAAAAEEQARKDAEAAAAEKAAKDAAAGKGKKTGGK